MAYILDGIVLPPDAKSIRGYRVRYQRNGLQAVSRRFNQFARAESFRRRLPYGSAAEVVPVVARRPKARS